jgi:hypothetical protein
MQLELAGRSKDVRFGCRTEQHGRAFSPVFWFLSAGYPASAIPQYPDPHRVTPTFSGLAMQYIS